MKIVSLTLSGYRQFFEPTTLTIPQGLTGVCGPNGVGKSKLIEAIGYALYGPHGRILPSGDKAADLPSHAGTKVVPRVELTIELRGQRYEIVRSSKEVCIRAQGTTNPLADGASAVNRKVVELLHLSPASYRGTFVAYQNEVAGLQALPGPERQRIVNRLIGVAQVEKAIELAREARRSRKERWEQEQRHLYLSYEQATTDLTVCRAAQVAAIEEQERLDLAFADARNDFDRAAAKMQELQQRRQQVEAYQKQLQTLDEHQKTLDTMLKQTQQKIDESVKAKEQVAQADAIILATEELPAQQLQFTMLQQRDELRRRRTELEQRLVQEILPRASERTTLQRIIADNEAEIEKLVKNLQSHQMTISEVKQVIQQAHADVTRYQRLRTNAEQLGPSGVCDSCGQAFGESLVQALANYGEAVQEARQREVAAHDRMVSIQEIADQIETQIKERRTERDSHNSKLKEYETLPGEEHATRQDLTKLNSQWASIPVVLQEQLYDAEAHRTVIDGLRQREQAEQDIFRLRPVVQQEQAARNVEQQMLNQLTTLLNRHRELEKQIKEDAPTSEEADQASAKLEEAKLLRDEQERAVRGALQKATRAEAAVQAAEEKLRAVEQQEQHIAAAKRAFLVAERTEEILRRLLEEITAEARPRLAELMDMWGRSLFGGRFQSIDLTPDYRILADNGSGAHHIEHFSGGEQTLLAVMLRVAISIFCRERAGFDTGFLILDEVFGNQDGERRTQLVQFLEEIKEHYHQILIVNHVEDVTNMLDSIIEVQRTGSNTSVAQLRT